MKHFRRGESGSICVSQCWHSNHSSTLLFLFVLYYSLSRSHSRAIHHARGQDCGLTFPLTSAIVPSICHSHLLSLLQTLHLSLRPPKPLSVILRRVKDMRHGPPPLLFSARRSISPGSLCIAYCFVRLISYLCLPRFIGFEKKVKMQDQGFLLLLLLCFYDDFV